MLSGCRFLECPPAHMESGASESYQAILSGGLWSSNIFGFIEGIWLVEAVSLTISQVTVTRLFQINCVCGFVM